MTNLETYIQAYFKIPEESTASVATLFQEENFKKGDYFVRQGTYCQKMSFQTNGFIRVFTERHDKEITQWIGSKNHFITDLSSFIFGQRARWHIQAITDCKLYTITLDQYKTLSKVVPNWPELEQQFLAACFLTLEDRVFSHLSMSAEERYLQFYQQNKALFSQVPLQYIASMLGMSPETFSRIRKKIQ